MSFVFSALSHDVMSCHFVPSFWRDIPFLFALSLSEVNVRFATLFLFATVDVDFGFLLSNVINVKLFQIVLMMRIK